MQYPEHAVPRERAEIVLAVERVDGAEPLREAAVVVCVDLGVVEELLHLDYRDGLLVEIEQVFLVAGLYRMDVVVRHLPRVGIRELETDEIQVLENGRFVLLHHAANDTRHVEQQPVLVDAVGFVLDLDGDAVARLPVSSVVGQGKVGLRVAVAEFPGDEGVHDFRMLDAVGAGKAERGVHEVRGERDVLLARKYFLEDAVVVDVGVLVFMRLHDDIKVQSFFVCFTEFREKVRELFSNHL